MNYQNKRTALKGNKMTHLIRIYNAHNEEEVYIKKEFTDDSFDELDECFEYYKKKYPFNNISVSPLIDNMTISDKLQELNEKVKKQ